MENSKTNIYTASFVYQFMEIPCEYVLVSSVYMEKDKVNEIIRNFIDDGVNQSDNWFIISAKTYKNTLNPIFNEIKTYRVKEVTKMPVDLETYIPKEKINGWVLTDDDCLQYLKKINQAEYRCIQLAPYPISEGNEDTILYQVCQADIDVIYNMKTDPAKVVNILASYGYCDYPDDSRFITSDDVLKVVNYVLEDYGEAGYQIIAECIFEDIPFYDIRIFKGTEEECISFIEAFCEKY